MPASRRAFLYSLAGLVVAMGATRADAKTESLRVGFQKSSTLFAVLKARGTLEAKLKPIGVEVTWSEFTSGLPLLEALNIGSLDVAADVADTVPLFAQAAGAQITYVAQEAPSPTAQAIVVRSGSPIRDVADLKGKSVAVTRTAGSHYLLIAALAKAGLKLSDITPAYLTPADGRAAFSAGNVDAWVTWEPFLSAVESQADARILRDGRDLASYQRYYLAATRYLAARPDVIQIVFDELKAAGTWTKAEPKQAAELLAPEWKLAPKLIESANSRRSYDVRPVTPQDLVEQQRIADAFFAEGLLPKKLDATALPLWKPAGKPD